MKPTLYWGEKTPVLIWSHMITNIESWQCHLEIYGTIDILTQCYCLPNQKWISKRSVINFHQNLLTRSRLPISKGVRQAQVLYWFVQRLQRLLPYRTDNQLLYHRDMARLPQLKWHRSIPGPLLVCNWCNGEKFMLNRITDPTDPATDQPGSR